MVKAAKYRDRLLTKEIKLDFPNLDPLLTDHNVFSSKLHDGHPLDSLVNYFTEIDTVSISLWGTIAGMALVFLIIIAILAIYCCPTIVSRLCCCATRTNCLATILEGRKTANTEFTKWKKYTATEAAAEAAQSFRQSHSQPFQGQAHPATAPPLDQETQPLQAADAPSYAFLRHSEPAI